MIIYKLSHHTQLITSCICKNLIKKATIIKHQGYFHDIYQFINDYTNLMNDSQLILRMTIWNKGVNFDFRIMISKSRPLGW